MNITVYEKRFLLNPKPMQVLNFIQKWTEENGYPPTFREVGVECNIPSTSTVNYYIERLIKFGCIENNLGGKSGERRKARSLILTEIGLSNIGLASRTCPECGSRIVGKVHRLEDVS